jgi:hypothetical protein
MLRRIMISGAMDTHVNGIAEAINKQYGYPIYDMTKDGFWGLKKEEQWILTSGPAESLINQKIKYDPKNAVKVYSALTHIIICPVVAEPWEFLPIHMFEACLMRAYQFLESYAPHRIPTVILAHTSKDDNWRLIVSLLSDIKIVKSI